MKTISILSFSVLLLTSCAIKGNLSKEDQRQVDLGNKYPACHHHYKIVFEKCVELNESGKKVDAMRTEQIMKDDKSEG